MITPFYFQAEKTKGTLIFLMFLSLSGCADRLADSQATEVPTASTEMQTPLANPSPISPSPSIHPISLEALMTKEIIGDSLTLEETLDTNSQYIRYRISYRANGLKISGILNVPKGDGPFPLLLLNHGYIDPAVYTNGRGLKREQDYLARRGFAVLHSDYRNHAFSDKDPGANANLRLGYVEDVVAAIYAVRESNLPDLQTIDAANVGMLGHSMGGGIAQKVAVTRPDLVKAFVLYAPVSGNEAENFSHYIFKDKARRSLVDEIRTRHGLPEDTPKFWRGISPESYYDRITAPMLIFIGTIDESTPPTWSEAIAEKLKAQGKQVERVVFEGERHEFGLRWSEFMEKSTAFFTEHLK